MKLRETFALGQRIDIGVRDDRRIVIMRVENAQAFESGEIIRSALIGSPGISEAGKFWSPAQMVAHFMTSDQSLALIGDIRMASDTAIHIDDPVASFFLSTRIHSVISPCPVN